ncbi:hypothetical protein VPH35_113266 [Triticum aestivum]
MFPRYKRFEQLVKLVINLRGESPLVTCKIDAYPDDDPEHTFTNTKLLIDYALACEAEELVVRAADIRYDIPMFDVPLNLISQHLKTLHLERINLDHSDLKFSGCPVEISSMSLKCLSIIDVCYLRHVVRIRICSPGLISLQLDDFEGLTPCLENMPLLETAYVGLGDGCYDFCRDGQGDCSNPFCGCHFYPVNNGVLLGGFSNVVKLELIALPRMFIYKWDLECWPIFCKLRTLILNEWFTANELVCILQHSPLLEMLTLQVGNTEHHRSNGGQEMIEKSFVCAHVKVVTSECKEVDEGIHEILKTLRTGGILCDHISIKTPAPSTYSVGAA